MNESQPTIAGSWEDLFVLTQPSLQGSAGIQSRSQVPHRALIPAISLCRLESAESSMGHVRHFLQYSLDHRHPVTQLENIFRDECLQKRFREEREEGEREGERKIIQTKVEMGSYRIEFTIQLSHLKNNRQNFDLLNQNFKPFKLCLIDRLCGYKTSIMKKLSVYESSPASWKSGIISPVSWVRKLRLSGLA